MVGRVLMMVLYNILWIPLWWYQLCTYGKHADEIPEKKRYALIKKIVHGANRGGRVEITVHGTEHLPEEDGFVMFPNHQGMFDVLAIADVCDHPFSVVAKKEVENVFFLKQVFAVIQAKMMDRSDVRQSMKVIMAVTEEVKQGRNYIIFPEGTRSKNGNQLLDFKGGSFKSAMNAKCPIVPVAILNTYQVFDRGSIAPVHAQVHFLKPLFYEEYQGMKSVEIAEIVRQRIEETIQANERVC